MVLVTGAGSCDGFHRVFHNLSPGYPQRNALSISNRPGDAANRAIAVACVKSPFAPLIKLVCRVPFGRPHRRRSLPWGRPGASSLGMNTTVKPSRHGPSTLGAPVEDLRKGAAGVVQLHGLEMVGSDRFAGVARRRQGPPHVMRVVLPFIRGGKPPGFRHACVEAAQQRGLPTVRSGKLIGAPTKVRNAGLPNRRNGPQLWRFNPDWTNFYF